MRNKKYINIILLLIAIAGFFLLAKSSKADYCLNVNQGGTGKCSLTNGSIFYGSSTDESLNELPIGTAGYILQSDGVKPIYVATSTLGIIGGASSGPAGYLQFSNGSGGFNSNSNLLWDNSNTKLGINSSSPAALLSVKGTGTIDTLKITNQNGARPFVIDNAGNVGINTTSPGAILAITAPSLSTVFNIASTSGFSMFRINGNGEVSIHSSTPITNYALTIGKMGTLSANVYVEGRVEAGTSLKAGNSTLQDSSYITGNTGGYTFQNGNQNAMVGTNYFSILGFNFNDPTYTTSTMTGFNIALGYRPTSGTGTYTSLAVTSNINQRCCGNPSGITRGFYLKPTLTSNFDYRNFEIPAITNNLSASTSITTGYNVLFNGYTYTSSSGTLHTLAEASTLNIQGAPKGTAEDVVLTQSAALKINGGSLASTTNAYGLYLTAPSGATSNYAAAFLSGNVGIGTATPAATLDVAGTVMSNGGSANKAVCWKSDSRTLGYCSSAVDAFGACTCN